jgi:hypothetical protein
MKPKRKYDVAVSFAEEDAVVAEKIVRSLERRKIKTYYYKDHSAIHWGEDLFTISYAKYAIESRCILTIISKNYARKYWTDIERLILHSVHITGKITWLPLRLDDTRLEGLSNSTVCVKWNENADEIAALIWEKLRGKKTNGWYQFARLFIIAAFGLVGFLFARFAFEKYAGKDNKVGDQPERIKDSISVNNDGKDKNTTSNDPSAIIVANPNDTSRFMPLPPRREKPFSLTLAEKKMLRQLNGAAFISDEYADDKLNFTTLDSGRVSFNGNSTIHSINGTMRIIDTNLQIIDGNITGTLSILEHGKRITGTIRLKEYPDIALNLNYRRLGD